MKIRNTVLLAVTAALVGALVAPVTAAQIITTGTVVSTGRDSMVVKIDDHGHKIPFAIEATSAVPADLAVGNRVRVVYHPTGSTGQTADSVTILPGGAAKSRRSPAQGKKIAPERPNS